MRFELIFILDALSTIERWETDFIPEIGSIVKIYVSGHQNTKWKVIGLEIDKPEKGKCLVSVIINQHAEVRKK